MLKPVEEEIADVMPRHLYKVSVTSVQFVIHPPPNADVLENDLFVLPAKVSIHRYCDLLNLCLFGKSKPSNDALHVSLARIAPGAIDVAHIEFDFNKKKQDLAIGRQLYETVVVLHRFFANDLSAMRKPHGNKVGLSQRIPTNNVRVDYEAGDRQKTVQSEVPARHMLRPFPSISPSINVCQRHVSGLARYNQVMFWAAECHCWLVEQCNLTDSWR